MDIGSEPRATPVSGHPPGERLRATLPLADLVRSGDATTVERILRQAKGVLIAYANAATEMAYVEYDPQLTDVDSLTKIIESAGDTAAAEGS